MRIANGILAALLLLFAAVQLNDPDGLFWIVVYGIGAIWCGIAAWRAALYAIPIVYGLYALTCAAALVGLFYFWPSTSEWWMQDVWWETETAREGMGIMILVIALIVAGFIVRRARRMPV